MIKQTALTLLCSLSTLTFSFAAEPRSAWSHQQTLIVQTKGPVQIALPFETVARLQPSYADLRLFTETGEEVPFQLHQPVFSAQGEWTLEDLQIQSFKERAVVTGKLPSDVSVDSVRSFWVYTPVTNFQKSITIETSTDGRRWRVVVDHAPGYSDSSGERIGATIPRTSQGPFYRMSFENIDGVPLSISKVTAEGDTKRPSWMKTFSAAKKTVTTDELNTTALIELPYTNVFVSSLRVMVSETIVDRTADILIKEIRNGQIEWASIGTVSLQRATSDKMPLVLRVDRLIVGQELKVVIQNKGQAPLHLQDVTIEASPLVLRFDAPQAGAYQLAAGHPYASAKAIEWTPQVGELKLTPELVRVQPLSPNPAYQAPAFLPTVGNEGAALSPDAWQFRRRVLVNSDGLQQLAIPADLLSENEGRLTDFRLLRFASPEATSGAQVPYIIESDQSPFIPLQADAWEKIEAKPDLPNRPNVSRWVINLPSGWLPLTHLECQTAAKLFDRNVTLYAENLDARGSTPLQQISQVRWTRTPTSDIAALRIPIGSLPKTSRLIIEIDDGDNAALSLTGWKGFYTGSRILFKYAGTQPLFLYYGNPNASAPQYDFAALAPEILSKMPREATVAPSERMKTRPWWETPKPEGVWKYLFWAMLALVAGGLLFVIAKLVPEERP